MTTERVGRLMRAMAAMGVPRSDRRIHWSFDPSLALHEAAHALDLGLQLYDTNSINAGLLSLPKGKRRRTALRVRGMDGLAGAWSLFYFNGRIDYFLARWAHGREVLEQALAIAQRWNGEGSIREVNSWIDLGNMCFTPRDTAGVRRGLACWRRDEDDEAAVGGSRHPRSPRLPGPDII